MATAKFKVESGIQLLARLRRRPDIENFYPVLFESGPKSDEIVEVISGDDNASSFLIDIISEALIPISLGGVEAGILFFNTDGNIHFPLLENTLRRKLLSRVRNCSYEQKEYTDEELNDLLQNTISNLQILDVYDATQLYTTLHSLEGILAKHPNISVVMFDTLTAFYWSEQGFKITKMDVYLKTLLHMIQKITKEYKITIFYTRPEYFSSSKDWFKNLEGCSDQTTLEHVNYRLQTILNENGIYEVNVRTSSKLYKRLYYISDNEINWLQSI